MNLQERYRVEREHHDKIFGQRQSVRAGDFDSSKFYRTRPYGMQKLLDMVGIVEGLRVLDIGCGQGLFSIYFALKGASVYSFDISLGALHSFEPLRNVVRVLATAETLPLRNGTVDMIWGAAILHHLDLSLAISEFYRVLKPGGRCFFYEPLGYNPLFNLWRRWTPHLRTATERPLYLSDLEPFSREFGQQNVEVHYWHFIASIPQAVGKIIGLLGLPGKFLYRRTQQLEAPLDSIDRVLFRIWPCLKRYSQAIGIICTIDH